MDIWTIYRVITNSTDRTIDKIKIVEFCKSEDEARKYHRLFETQIPIDLKNKISHTYYHSYIAE